MSEPEKIYILDACLAMDNKKKSKLFILVKMESNPDCSMVTLEMSEVENIVRAALKHPIDRGNGIGWP